MNQTFLELLAEIEDFRTGNAIHYRLQDILLVSVLAVICNTDTSTEMAMFANHQRKYLEPFCDFRHGTPSHDTFGKVLSRLDPRVLSERFNAWMSELCVHLGKLAESRGMTVAIDGKTICRSGSSEQKASHVLTAFASRAQLVLGQIKTDEKSNEITAIPELLDLFQVKDTVVTIDAMGTQKDIAAKIIEKGGDYVLAVKGKSEETARRHHLAPAQRSSGHKHKRTQSQRTVCQHPGEGSWPHREKRMLPLQRPELVRRP
ncbi:ISAs1 family transposase [Pyramidobacter sp. YE332]|uniref:ISAs1 family transposase n=1 Tax=Pyramidobacter sp. YE332 TaxID=3068894 RepID=UPI00294B08CA|nr:ISAs1 family transposase [Pyramidobacter sp. YE332]WOL41015.1 ISAs1 family transposase [Pyramidobacter sp. YE332]